MTVAARIMIVEDDEIIASLITFILEKNGYKIAAKVSSGEESILRSAEVIPDLILMDIHLNGLMDGITAARFIFSLFRFPVIFLTGFCDNQLLERATAAQPYGYLIKPFTEKDLISNITIALHNHEVRKPFLDTFAVGDTRKILTAPESMIITDLQGRIIFFNPSTPRLLELSENELMMKPVKTALALVNEHTNEQLPDPVPEIARQMVVVIHEIDTVLVTRSGRIKPVSVTARPLNDDRNELFGVIIITREKAPAQRRVART